MKKNFWVLILIVIVLFVSVELWRTKQLAAVSHPVQSAAQPANEPANNPPPTNQGALPVLTTVISPTNGPELIIFSNKMLNPEVSRKEIESHNVPIHFYGKIVDQDSNALDNVRVQVSIRHWTVPDPSRLDIGSTEIYTGANSASDGRFEIHEGTGDGLDFESIIKDGYELEPGQRSFGATSGSFLDPVTFKMWSTNIHEKLIGGQKSFHIVPDGRPYFINLNGGTISETGDGDLKVWINYTNQVAHGQMYDWSAGINVISGGLVEEPLGSAMYKAPTDGYSPSFQLQQQIKGGQSGDIGERHFYVMLKNGQEYGQISINLYAPYNNQIPGMIRLSYAINPSGSRILR